MRYIAIFAAALLWVSSALAGQDLIAVGDGDVTHAQKYQFTVESGVTQNAALPAGGLIGYWNQSSDGSFTQKERFQYMMLNYSEAFDAATFWNPLNVPFGDDGDIQWDGFNTIAFNSSHTKIAARFTYVPTINGSGQVTALTPAGSPIGYAPNQSGIQTVIFQSNSFSGGVPQIATTVWGYADGSGNIAGFSKTQGGTTNDAFPTAYSGFSTDPSLRPLVNVQAPAPATGEIYMDAGPNFILSRYTPGYHPAPGSVVAYFSFGAAYSDQQTPVTYGALATEVHDNSQTEPRGWINIRTADSPSRGGETTRWAIKEGLAASTVALGRFEDKGQGTVNGEGFYLRGDEGSFYFDPATGKSRLIVDEIVTSGVLDGGPSSVGVRLSQNQTIPANTTVSIAFDSEDFDPESAYDSSTFRYQPTEYGIKTIRLRARIIASSFGGAQSINFYIMKNGIVVSQQAIDPPASGAMETKEFSVPVLFNGTTDYVEVKAHFVNSSGAYLFAANGQTYLSVSPN